MQLFIKLIERREIAGTKKVVELVMLLLGGSHIRQTAFPQLTGARNIFRVVRNSNPEVRTARLPFQVVSSHPRSR